jgi:DNA processing protein
VKDAPQRLRLARTTGVGPILFRRLMHRFGAAEAALDALPGIAMRAGRAGPMDIPALDAVQREIDAVSEMGGRFLHVDTPDYPPLLALLEDAPPVIGVLGDPAHLTRSCVALVGARNASANGMHFAARLADELAGRGVAVVSGLARGIDAASHQGAMARGVTIACIAGGLDQPYPAVHKKLQTEIAECGAVVAEAPLGTAPQARHFPRRNRVIAGLSLGVVVIEAALRSGSLITARLAQEEGRELFAVPGSPLDPRCHGSNALLRQGATLVENADDILTNLPDHPRKQGLSRDPLFAREPASPPPFPPDLPPKIAPLASRAALDAVAGLLGPSPCAVDDLVAHCQFSAPEVLAALLDLELAGRVETLPGSRVALLVPGISSQSMLHNA